MSKIPVTVFLCTDKDCKNAWRHVCDGSPGKWLKQHVEEAELPYKLTVVKTDCMDRCEEAATICIQHGRCAAVVSNIRHKDDVDHLLAELRACVETAVHQKNAVHE